MRPFLIATWLSATVTSVVLLIVTAVTSGGLWWVAVGVVLALLLLAFGTVLTQPMCGHARVPDLSDARVLRIEGAGDSVQQVIEWLDTLGKQADGGAGSAWEDARRTLARTVRQGSVAIGGPSRMPQGSTARRCP